ncbi:putative cytochrome P450 pisatin demethylase-like protein [Podospora australis]|uniref:Cytochrome P450 pisatin demethylase-like protein n=1 Tax=Podospora australis TaxID=1536484 RepID=A0AAN6WNQ7_9PEZI|nr:putative cytochrome P450 pisatin demethylase-like protein [Podospora australis]
MAIFVLLAGGILTYCVGWIIYARWFHPYAKYPGPFLASISRAWLVKEMINGHIDETQRRWHDKYGPIIRIAPDEVSIADPSAVQTIYGAHSGFTKTDFYSAFSARWARYPEHFASTNPVVHAARRKQVNHIYSMTNVSRYEDRIDACTNVFMERMRELADKKQPVELTDWFRWYAFDVIGELFYGHQFGFMERQEDYQGLIHATDMVMPLLGTSALIPSYLRGLVFMAGACIPRVLAGLKALTALEIATDVSVNERQALLDKKGGILDHEDMLSSCFRVMEETNDKDNFGELEIRGELYVAFAAGFDTTATAFTSIVYHLMKTPSAYRKLRAEIDEATAKGQLGRPNIRYAEAVKLPYMDACIQEGMRIHPSVGLCLPRHVPKGGCKIAGEFFAEGLRVGINPLVIQRDKSVFGEDADVFRPERWIEGDAAFMDKHILGFGLGEYTCLGKNISMMELYKMIPEFIRGFDLELVDPKKDWTVVNQWFNKPANVLTKVTARK